MSKMFFTKVAMGLATVAMATACASSNKKADNTPKTADQIAQEKQADADRAQAQAREAELNAQKAQDQVVISRMAADRQTYIQDAQKRLDGLTQRSDELHARAARASGAEKTHLDNVSGDLDNALTEVRRNLSEAKTAEPRYWLDQKRSVEKSMNKAEAAYNSSAITQ